MDGVQYQIEQLQYALAQLDPYRMLAPEDASQLQLGLANTTAIARRVVERQSRRTFPMRLAGVSVSGSVRPTLPSVSPFTSSPSRETPRKEPCDGSGNGLTSAGGKGSDAGESLPQHGEREGEGGCFYESVLSVATQHGVSVEEIRRYNPQLSEYNDEDVLPRNTYIKMKLQMYPQPHREDDTEQATVDARAETRQPRPGDTVSSEPPMPLAPLPTIQEALRRPMNSNAMLARGGGGSSPLGPRADSADSPDGPLMQLPSPSPDRSGVARRGNLTSHSIASKLHDHSHTIDINSMHSAVAPAPVAAAGAGNGSAVTEVSKGTLSAQNLAEVETMAAEAAPSSFSASKFGKPSLTQHKNTVPSANTRAISRYANRLWAGDYDYSLTTESSSFHSTLTPTPNMSPQPNKKNNQVESGNSRRGALGAAATPPPSLAAKKSGG
ncbi:uncharacterized protein Tco025E_02854 [Trypanosoma conorhini]|uniref:LysM domain-containing protein n=1 Tax=Trypanosoma conorhini TaxID=83891 RepID=A0A422Q0W2_9TRYP|nr:uncharacterized protein Tco025E_02854 [Trypanosoma conorhini]RNF23632.1 hypothetical protein Tco025E_02854 [Trypanosoma conorhini]